MKIKVKVFKDDIECGWYKDVVPGANAVIDACKHHGFDITKYHFAEYDNIKNIVWRGEKSMLDVA